MGISPAFLLAWEIVRPDIMEERLCDSLMESGSGLVENLQSCWDLISLLKGHWVHYRRDRKSVCGVFWGRVPQAQSLITYKQFMELLNENLWSCVYEKLRYWRGLARNQDMDHWYILMLKWQSWLSACKSRGVNENPEIFLKHCHLRFIALRSDT